MTHPAIRVTNLCKQYQLGAHQEKYTTLRDSIVKAARSPFRRFSKHTHSENNTLWALKDVSFDVPQGETLGVIGRNGAGKSTLLKVFSQITEPTSGRVDMNGRVASLLEVGTGFHKELTGRENVYLNGAILGMSRQELDRKFDQIVAFSEVERFIDTPVKRYSSGMQLRLAFSVAAHIEPEILVIDEILAVGDTSFQRRCVDRMKELTISGCTLLFVSHNMELIPSLCRSALWLRAGEVEDYGPAHIVTDKYIASMASETKDELLTDRQRTGDGRARFRRLEIVDDNGQTIPTIRFRKDLRMRLEIESTAEWPRVSLAFVVKTLNGSRIITGVTDEVGMQVNLTKGVQQFECRCTDVRLRPGRQVEIELWMNDGELMDCVQNARIYEVTAESEAAISFHHEQGVYVCEYAWSRV